jgi:ribose/xylose/arabinose/galactoside ABC-type transport system permease subunit
MQRILVALGLMIALAGLAWPWLSKLPLGRLPGDIIVDRPGLKVFFPITTMIVLSLVLSLALWLFRR